MKYLKKFSNSSEYDAFLASGQMVKPNVSLVADEGIVNYHRQTKVLIQHLDGSLYTTDQWTAEGFANDAANGVAVIADEAQFVIAPVIQRNLSWGDNGIIDGIMVSTDSSVAKTDYEGKRNTQLMLEAGNRAGMAAFTCDFVKMPNGQDGYLPSLGELVVAYECRDEINAARSLIGASAMGASQMWSSTQYSSDMAWVMSWEATNSVFLPTTRNITYAAPIFAELL